MEPWITLGIVGHHGGKARAGLQIERVFLTANNVFKLPKEQHSHTHVYKDNGNSAGYAGGNIARRGEQYYLLATFMRLNTYQSIRTESTVYELIRGGFTH